MILRFIPQKAEDTETSTTQRQVTSAPAPA